MYPQILLTRRNFFALNSMPDRCVQNSNLKISGSSTNSTFIECFSALSMIVGMQYPADSHSRQYSRLFKPDIFTDGFFFADRPYRRIHLKYGSFYISIKPELCTILCYEPLTKLQGIIEV
jgi:hypothetical protein